MFIHKPISHLVQRQSTKSACLQQKPPEFLFVAAHHSGSAPFTRNKSNKHAAFFFRLFPQLFLSICSYTDGGLSSPEQWLIRFVFPFNINTLSLRAKKLLPLTALLTERE